MAIKLKSGKTYSDYYSKTESSDYYGYIDICNISKKSSRAVFILDIFKESTIKTDRNIIKPIKTEHISVDANKFDDYFSIVKLNENDAYNQAYNYLLNEVRLNGEFIDGEFVDGELKYKDWESDE